jgi:hypothetical protein
MLDPEMSMPDWLMTINPTPMLHYLDGRMSGRKMRLLVAGACLRINHLLPDRCRIAATALELYADSLISTEKYREAWGQAEIECRMCATDPPDATMYAAESVLIPSPPTTPSVESALSIAAMAYGTDAASRVSEEVYDTAQELNRSFAAEEQAHLVRCLFGNPFTPVNLNSAWLTSTVLALAHGIYSEKAFDGMPILADALQDAGCDNEDILSHCRSDGSHVRGCWVVDLLLGKE